MDILAFLGADEASAFDLNAIGEDFLEDPFPMYRALREYAPIHVNPDSTYFLTRFDDVMTGYRHADLSSDKTVDFKPKFGDGPLYTHHTTSLVFNDDPYHKRVRKLMAGAFSPRQITALTDLQRALQAQEFLHRRLDQGGIIPKASQFARIFEQDGEPVAGHAGGRLVARVQEKDAVLHQFLVAEFFAILLAENKRRQHFAAGPGVGIFSAVVDQILEQCAEILDRAVAGSHLVRRHNRIEGAEDQI